MRLSLAGRFLLRGGVAVALTFIYVPLLVVVVTSFNADSTFSWPPEELTLHWWSAAGQNAGAREAVVTSAKVGLAATGVALVLGTMAAFALSRQRFFGRDTVSLLVVLPIALPGIVTGIALNNAFRTVLGIDLGYISLVVAHATFCVVVVFNNVAARLRRLGGSVEEASMDLGATRLDTFRLVTLPSLGSALVAGGLLAFALSFDEIIVTTFTAGAEIETLPIWIFSNLFRPNNAPVVNVVGTVLILASVIPIWLSQRLSGDTAGGRL